MNLKPFLFEDLLRPVLDNKPTLKEATGVLFLVITLLALSIFISAQTTMPIKTLMPGQVATEDIVAPVNLLYEDVAETEKQKQVIRDMCPSICDLKPASAIEVMQLLPKIISIVNEETQKAQAATGVTPSGQVPTPNEPSVLAPVKPNLAQIAVTIKTKLSLTIPQSSIKALLVPTTQEYLLKNYMPWVIKRLNSGVVTSHSDFPDNNRDIIIRGNDGDQNLMHRSVKDLTDTSMLVQQSYDLFQMQSGISISAARALQDLAGLLIRPSLSFNRADTERMSHSMEQSVMPVYKRIHKGDIIISKGQEATPVIQKQLQALSGATGGFIHVGKMFGTFFVIMLLTLPMMFPLKAEERFSGKDYFVLASSLVLLVAALSCTISAGNTLMSEMTVPLLPYLCPVACLVGLFALLWERHSSVAFSLLCSFMATSMFNGGIALFLTFFFMCVLTMFIIVNAPSRQDIVRGILPLFVGNFVITLSGAMLSGLALLDNLELLFAFTFCNTLLTVFMLFALSPIMETGLHYATRFRLMELMNMNQPVLQELMVTTPGTYHHSLLVSNLAEAGAKLIGADPLLCKVGGLYHDIGKLARPEYFIENQKDGPNKHDSLTPSMSAKVLVSHVKKGVELAHTFHLGDEISAIIQQHHGTSTMQYFYNKAKQMGENPETRDYSYPGPRPQTKEAAIVMMADVVEASTRTLQDPTPARLANHVSTMIKNLLTSGQLDESALTFRDIHIIADCFTRMLTGIYHHRIAYPSGDKKPADGEKKPANGDKKPADNVK